MATDRLAAVIEAIDRFNADDPRKETVGGSPQPSEVVYSERLTDWVLRLEPNASPELRIAARGQHIGRWTVPRSEYPMDRAGYLRWREMLKRFHADTVAEIMRTAGCPDDSIGHVRTLILKRRPAGDAEGQALEDALCLVFLETQFLDLQSKTPDDTMLEIIRKTWKKMGPKGREAALKLPLDPRIKETVQRALTTSG